MNLSIRTACSGRMPLAAVALAALAFTAPATWAQSSSTGSSSGMSSSSGRVAPNPKDPAARSYDSGTDTQLVTPYGAHPSGSLSGSTTGAAGRSAYGTSSNVPAGSTPDSQSNTMSGTTSGVSTTGAGTGNAVPPSTGAAGTTGMGSGSTSGMNSSSGSAGSSASGSGLTTPAAGVDTSGASSYDPPSRAGTMGTTGTSSSSSDMALPSEPTAAGYGSGSSGFDASRQSWIPYTSNGYVSIAYGGAEFDLRCVAGQQCDNPDWAAKIATGGMLNEWLGIELGYLHTGEADHNGGTARARGVSLSLTGFLPLNYGFSLMAKVGGTYGMTKISGNTVAGAPRGSEEGFGVNYGAGVSFDFNRNWSLTLEWERHRMKFAGDDDRDVDLATVGVRYRF